MENRIFLQQIFLERLNRCMENINLNLIQYKLDMDYGPRHKGKNHRAFRRKQRKVSS